LEGEGDGPLLQLCACRGSAKLVHRHCLEKWRRSSLKEDAAYRCGECKDEYRDALSLELLRARLQAERADGEYTVFTLNTLALKLQAQGKYDEAEPLYREAVKVSRETVGNRHPDTLTSINNLGLLLQAKGDLAAAEPLYREALEVQRETLGDRHPSTLHSINSLGVLLQVKGDLAATEPLIREALEARRETLGDRHPSTLHSINSLGELLQDKGDLAATEPLLREAECAGGDA
jgi:tetratricopeptide (TPR) repeat protein